MINVLSKFFVDYVEDTFDRFYENYEDTYFDGDPQEMVDLLFEQDSYKEGYHNIDSFYTNHAFSDEYSLFNYEQAVMIKIVNNKLKIVYNRKGKTKYYKNIKKFNRKRYKFALEKERLKSDNQEWYNAFLNKYYFQDEISLIEKGWKMEKYYRLVKESAFNN